MKVLLSLCSLRRQTRLCFAALVVVAAPWCAVAQVPPVTKLVVFDGKAKGAYPVQSLVPAGGGFLGATSGERFYTNSTLFKVTLNGQFSTLARFTNPTDDPKLPVSWPSFSDIIQAGSSTYLIGGGFYKVAGGELEHTPMLPAPELGGFNSFNDFVWGRDGNFYGYALEASRLVIRVRPDGTSNFLGGSPNWEIDGPIDLIQASDENLYGIENDTLFRVNRRGGYSTLFDFQDRFPSRGLVQGKDGNLYGTFGGTRLFKISTQGSDLRVFNPSGEVFGGPSSRTLKDIATFFSSAHNKGWFGYSIGAGLVLDLIQGRDGNFYGRTIGGGGGLVDPSDRFGGTIFKITPTGRVEVIAGLPRGSSGGEIGDTRGNLVQGSDGSLYGTITQTRDDPYGIIFKVDAELLRDSELPAVRITYPAGRRIFTNRSRIVMRGTAKDDVGVKKMQTVHWPAGGGMALRERALRASPSDPNLMTWTAAVVTDGLDEGEHPFRAFAFDKVGKVSNLAEVTIVMDRTAPASLPDRPPGEVGSNVVEMGSNFELRQVLANAKQRSVILRGLAADRNGVARVDYRLKTPASAGYGSWKSGEVEVRKPVDLGYGASFDRNWTVNADLDSKGQWRMQVRVSDVAGNSTTWTFTINRT